MSQPLTVGHRGASALARENSLRAFELCIEFGLDLAELDVHLSRDRALVVVHDADLSRLFGASGQVAELTAGELREIGVPTLTDVFELTRGRLGLYVELKGPGTGEALEALLAQGAAQGVKIIAGSFEPDLVKDVRGVPRSVLFSSATVAEMIETCHAVGARYAHPCFGPITADIVDGLHGAELQVMTPHTNDVDEARYFASIGVDVIASDDPHVLQRLSVTA